MVDKIKSKDEPTKILIVDDDENTRHTLQCFLSDHGYQTHSVGVGDDALNYLKNKKIDAVITNIVHPGINGIELTKIVRNFYNAEVLILSGRVSDGYTPEELLGIGASATFQKPMKLDDLLYTLKGILKKA